MNIKELKEAPDKTSVDSVRGVIEKQYAPQDPTDNDLKFNQHRQSFLIHDESGEKLMVTLMKSQIHILDSVEGHELILTSATNEKGEHRGLLLNRWRTAGKDYDSVALKVYPDATIRAILPTAAPDPAPAPAAPAASAPAPAPAPAASAQKVPVSEFEKELALSAYAYCLCLDTSQQIINDRPLLKTDPESLRAIATNLWMSSKHHVRTLAPYLNGSKSISKGAGGVDAADTRAVMGSQRKPDSGHMQDGVLIARVLKGGMMAGRDTLDSNGLRALSVLRDEISDRGLWDEAYDTMIAEFAQRTRRDNSVIQEAANAVFLEAQGTLSTSAHIEKFLVSEVSMWTDSMEEYINSAK